MVSVAGEDSLGRRGDVERMKCPQCGADNPDDAARCALCYSPLGAPRAETPAARRRFRPAWLIPSVLLLASILAAAYYQLSVAPGKAALAHAKQELREQLAALEQYLPGSKPFANIARRMIDSTEMSVSKAEPGLSHAVIHIETTITFAGQTISYTQPVCLDREGLRWKVNVNRTMQRRARDVQQMLEGAWADREALSGADKRQPPH